MVQVIDNQVVKAWLPASGYLRNGESVSGYNLLPADILQSEGWLPIEDNKPEYNVDIQYLVVDSYTIQTDKVIVNYKAVDILV